MGVEPSRDRFDSPTICAVFLMTAFWVLGNWPVDYAATAHQYFQPPNSYEVTYETYLFRGFEVRKAGFPFSYYVREEDDGTEPQLFAFHLLAINVLVGVMSTVVCGFVVYRATRGVQRSRSQASNLSDEVNAQKRYLYFKLAALATAATGLALIVSTIVVRGNAARNEAQRLSLHGSVHMYAIVPKPLQNVFPKVLLGRFARIRSVAIWEQSDAMVAHACEIPSLHSLSIFGELKNQEVVTELIAKGQLKQLQVHDTLLGDALQEAIASSNRLRRIDLRNCKGLSRGLPRIHRDSRLREMDFTNSDVVLSSLPSKCWPQSLKRLTLPRPMEGSSSLLVEDSLSLETLEIASHLYPANASVVEVYLDRLPALEYVGLETEQKYALNITASPRLRSIGFIESDMHSRSSFDDMMPGAHWFSSVSLSGLPSLRELTIDGSNLEKLKLEELPNLQRLSIGRYIQHDGMLDNVQNVSSGIEDQASRLQSLINDLGNCDLPPSLDLSSLPLKGLDLSPLTKSKRLRSLCLARCGIEGSQLPALAKVKRLKHLDLRECPITDKQALSLLDQDLLLDDLLVSSETFERIKIVKQPQLRNFPANHALRARAVLIQDSPKLESELVLGDRLERLSVRDGHALKGISINGPVPIHCELHGLRSLKFFAMGGPEVDDDLCQNLWQCTDLDHLTIAYGNLSRQSLQNIGRFSKLTVLSLPGSKVDDDLIARHWSGLRLLSEVNLSHTHVSAKTASMLIALKNLQRLYVNHCQMDKHDLRDLVNVNQLIELEVAGVGLDPDTLLGCLRRGMLDRLDLSNSQVTDEMISALASPSANSLAFLGLKGCGLNESQLARIVDAHPDLALDVEGNNASQEWLDLLRQDRRLLSRDDRKGFLRRLVNAELGRSPELQIGTDSGRGRIDPHQFVNLSSLESQRNFDSNKTKL
jgi:Leucine-rich repeat (LRR) protein